MECLPQTGLSAGTTVAIVAIALALIAVAIVLIVKSRRARTGALMAIGLVGLLGALPLAGAPNAAGATVTETAVSTVTETAPGPTTMVTSTAPRECTTPPAWLTAYTTQGGWLQGESYVVQADEDTTGAGGGDALARIEEILTRGTVDGQALCDLKITWVQTITQSTEPDNTMGRTLTYTGWNHASNGPLHLAFDAGEWGQQPWFEWNNLTTTITAQLSFTQTGGGTGSSEITLSGPFQVAMP